MLKRSSNCSTYEDSISVLAMGTATGGGDTARCTVPLTPTLSCQKKQFEAPDTKTMDVMKSDALQKLQALDCDITKVSMDVKTNLIGSRNVEYSGEELRSLGMASNCYKAGNDPNDATHRATARCYNQKEMTDELGNKVINTNMPIHANLSVCDMSDEAAAQIYEDLRKVAVLNVKDRGYTVHNPEDLACSFSVLPQI